MHRKEAIAWVVNVCSSYLLLSQAKTLGVLVSAMRCNRISLANIGRQMAGTVKHQIKRCWRFCAMTALRLSMQCAASLRRCLSGGRRSCLSRWDWGGYQRI